MPLSYQLRAHGTQIPIPLAHRLPSERATTFTDHSDLSIPVDASDGHRPAARASPSAASAMCTKRRCRCQFLFHQPTLPHESHWQRWQGSVRRGTHWRKGAWARAILRWSRRAHDRAHDWGNRLGKAKASGWGQGGSKGASQTCTAGQFCWGLIFVLSGVYIHTGLKGSKISC